jgi:hypothetical protein
MDRVFARTALDLNGTKLNRKTTPIGAAKSATNTITSLNDQTFDAILLKLQSCSQTCHASTYN